MSALAILPEFASVQLEWYRLASDTDYTAAFARAYTTGWPIELIAGRSYQMSMTAGAGTCPGIFSRGGLARIVPPASADSDTRLLILTKNQFRIENLFFDMPVKTDGTHPLCSRGISIDTTGGSDYWITGCKFVGGRNQLFGNVIDRATITDNIFIDFTESGLIINQPSNVTITGYTSIRGGYNTSLSSSSMRLGSSSNTGVVRNVVITKTVVDDCLSDAIDLFSAYLEGVVIDGATFTHCGNGIELKTDADASGTLGYRAISISNVVCKFRNENDNHTGVSLNLSGTTAASDKAGLVHIENFMVFCETMATTTYPIYGFVVNGYSRATIVNCDMYNLARGFNITPTGNVGTITEDILISGCKFRGSFFFVNVSGTGTVNKLRIYGNDAEVTAGLVISIVGSTVVTNLEANDNKLVALAAPAVDIRNVSDSKFYRNEIYSDTSYGVWMRSAGNTNIKLYDNEIETGPVNGFDAVRVDVGSGVEIKGKIKVRAARQGVSGVGTYWARNWRGTASAIPTVGGGRGDYFEAENGDLWRNTTPGSGGAAVWQYIDLAA